MSNAIRAIAAAGLLAVASTGWAEQARTFGSHEVHYSAVGTTTLPAEIAAQYGIQRSARRAMINITVIDTTRQEPRPVRAEVGVTAVNLSEQLRRIDMRRIVEGEAVYNIGTFRITDGETLEFTVRVRPPGREDPHLLSFRKTFHIE